ncbi:transcriptional regulator, TetR family [Streptosporangium subroseum]|uniref:Transcriptional regulator, TetR family n=1 Tax=Streptosporangium subroseum TaxID=106412 RepID=A0A239P2E9_9ACTN|nr:substrate-binding domain-containing protein [Streptosporangium subroseum]SNT60903.1 transcriptional regulator, TetR family [Streptosporangium subroseum]
MASSPSSERSPARRERKKAETRRAIAHAARRLFAERGFEVVTVAEIAALADVSSKTVFNHFPAKEQLHFEHDPLMWRTPAQVVRERAAGEPVMDAVRRVLSRAPAPSGKGPDAGAVPPGGGTDAGAGPSEEGPGAAPPAATRDAGPFSTEARTGAGMAASEVFDAEAVAVHARIYRDSPALRAYAREMFAGHERALREVIEAEDGPEPGIMAAILLAPVREVWEATLLRIAEGAAFDEAAEQGRQDLDAAFDLLARGLPGSSRAGLATSGDLATPGELGTPGDLTTGEDLAAPGDLATPGGLAPREDLPDRGDLPGRGGLTGPGEGDGGAEPVPARPRGPARGDRPSITRVAQLAGVSATTVSHALNGRRPVADDTRRRVLEAIERLGYRPNALARGLRTSRSQTIGLVIPDITNPFYPALARGLQDVLGPAGYDQIISNTDGERRLERAAIEQMIARQVDGLAFAVFHTHPEDLLPAIEAGISVVRLGGRLVQDGVDVVHSDDEGGSAEATRYLLERGYRRVGFVCGPHAEGPAAERVAGYRSALRAAGMAVDPSLVAHTHFSRAGGASGTARLLDLPEPPDAVLCANDIMAIGALDTADERGLRVPADLAVMGFDDIEAATLVSPRLTTMANPAREIGQACARRLLERLSGVAAASSGEVVIPARLVRRQSA